MSIIKDAQDRSIEYRAMPENSMPDAKSKSNNDAQIARDVEQRFAEERSHRSVVLAWENSRAVGQAAILINGGAASALLAFASTKIAASILLIIPVSVIMYALGVIFGLLILNAAYKANMAWNQYFQAVVHSYPEDFKSKMWSDGYRYGKTTDRLVALSIGFFVAASGVLSLGFFLSRLAILGQSCDDQRIFE